MRALSIDGELLDQLLVRPFATRVHSSFDHAINVSHGAGLFTFLTAGTDNCPRALVVATSSFADLDLSTSSRVTVSPSRLTLGELVVELKQARPWQPVLPAWTARRTLVSDFRRLVETEGTRDDSVTTPTVRDFELALGGFDLDAAYWHGTRLVGLGGGLTPAGDDYLVGMCTALALPGPGWQPHRDLLARVVDTNGHRTTDISRVALGQASRGRVRESIIDLAGALVSGDERALRHRARRLLAIGHSSGTDIAWGLIGGLRLRSAGATVAGRPELSS